MLKLIIVLLMNNINFHTVFKNQLDPTYLLLSHTSYLLIKQYIGCHFRFPLPLKLLALLL